MAILEGTAQIIGQHFVTFADRTFRQQLPGRELIQLTFEDYKARLDSVRPGYLDDVIETLGLAYVRELMRMGRVSVPISNAELEQLEETD